MKNGASENQNPAAAGWSGSNRSLGTFGRG